MKILIATKNPAKFSDLSNSLTDLPYQFISLSDINFKEDFPESGKTFEENAKNKALFYARKSGFPTISDDGGLEINILNFEPGVKTRRWIDNKEATDEQLIKYTLIRMKQYHGFERTAQLRAVICLALTSDKTYLAEGKIKGIVAYKPYKQYKKGFPFDALLYFPDKKKYYYQLKYEDKDSLNHRTIALKKLKPILKSIFK